MTNLIETSAFSFPKSEGRKNQDSILSPRKLEDGYLLAVADGVGSYTGGGTASQIAIEHLRTTITKSQLLDTELLLSDIKGKIIDFSETDNTYAQAATTLTFAFINHEGLRVTHIGDCRVYLKEDNHLIQLTRDHTQFQRFVDDKVFTKKYLEGTKAKSILTTAIAANIEMKADSFFIPIESLPKENKTVTLYIMSDGAHCFWDKRPRFSERTMNSMSQFSNNFKRRIEKLSPVDDYSLVGIVVELA